MDADRLIDLLNTLPAADLRRVHAAAAALVAQLDEWQQPDYAEQLQASHSKTYQQEYIRCGKERCRKCAPGGLGHGPYWYAYWSEGGRTRKEYIGKRKPTELESPAEETR